MRNLFRRPNGFSLVDTMIGATILLYVVCSTAVVIKLLTAGLTTSSHLKTVNLKMNSVAETLRLQASGPTFDSMTTTECKDVTSYTPIANNEQDIKICAIIQQPDIDNRSRDVTLVATYLQNGVSQTKSMHFTLSRIKSANVGIRVRVKVAKFGNPGVGVPGIKVQCPGQDTLYQFVTDSNGEITFTNGKRDLNGLDIVVDGTDQLCYFRGPPNTYQKTVHTGDTSSAVENTQFYDTPIQICTPAVLQGVVTDEGTGSPVVANGAQVVLTPHTLEIPSTTDLSVQTNSMGAYSIKLIPGTYSVFLVGSPSLYSSPVQNLDLNGGISDITLGVDQLMNKNFSTIKRGTIKGVVRGLTYDSMTQTYVLSGNVFRGGKLYLNRDNSGVIRSGSWEDLTYTKAYQTWFLGGTSDTSSYDILSTDLYGNYEKDFFTPALVDKNVTLSSQYNNTVTIHPMNLASDPNDVAPPFTPIIVFGPTLDAVPPFNKNNMYFYIRNSQLVPQANMWSTDGLLVAPHSSGKMPVNFQLTVSPNQVYNHDVYLLEQSALANIYGDILSSTTFNPDGSYALYHPQTTSSSERGYICAWLGQGYTSYGQLMNSTNTTTQQVFWTPHVGSIAGSNNCTDMTDHNTCTIHYDFSTARPAHSFLPTLANEQQALYWEYEPTMPTSYFPFTGSLAVTQKVWDSTLNKPKLQMIPYTSLPTIHNIIISYGATTATMDVLSGQAGQFWTTTLFPISSTEYIMASTTTAVLPGQSVQANLVIYSSYTAYNNIYVGFASGDDLYVRSSTFPVGGMYYSYTTSPGPTHMYSNNNTWCGGSAFPMAKLGVTGTLYGKVLDSANGLPVIGAVVTYHRNYDTYVDSFTTVADVRGDGSNFQYQFNNERFYPSSETTSALIKWDFYIAVQHTAYSPATEYRLGYEGETGEIDFNLSAGSASGPHGGG